MKYTQYVKDLVNALGGAKNINSVTHCATRLRFLLVDGSKADKTLIDKLEYTVGSRVSRDAFQVIIGMHVGDVYNELLKVEGVKSEPSSSSDEGEGLENKSKFDVFLSIISAIFTPYIPVLASAGIIKGLLSLLSNFGWLSETSNTYLILSAAGNSLIYFFPILLAFTAAKKFGSNPYIGAAIGAALMEPNLTSINITGQSIDFLGIKFVAQSFENTVIPIILAMFAFSYLEKGLKKVLPKSSQLVLVPLISLIVMLPAILLIFGPVGFAIANGVAFVYEWMLGKSIILMSVLFGAFFIYVIMLGMHWVVLPIQLSILAEKGFEYSLCAGGIGNYALLGVCLGVFFASRDKSTKSMAISAAFVNFLSGITEPGLYGIVLKNKKYFAIISISGAIGGLICGIFNCYITNFAFTGLFGLPAFASSPTAKMYFVSVVVTIALGFIITYALEKGISLKKTTNSEIKEMKARKNEIVQEIIVPVQGEVVTLSDVNDSAFSSEALGKGCAIYPTSDNIYAPVDGEITFLFNTKHAIGITTKSGVEILIHIGINTVSLEGKYFEAFVKQGDKVKKGDKLVTFDREKVKEAGLDPTTMIIVTNSDSFESIELIAKGYVDTNTTLINII